MSIPDNTYIEWLVSQSMLHAARERSRHYAGQARLWQRPYAQAARAMPAPSPRCGSPPIRRPSSRREGGTVLEALGDDRLWSALSNSACRASQRADEAFRWPARTRVHPDHRRQLRPHQLRYRPEPGDRGADAAAQPGGRGAQRHRHRRHRAGTHRQGADFRLAEMAYGDYPGCTTWWKSARRTGSCCPVPAGRDSVNLLPPVVDRLKEKHYIVGQLQRVIFFEPGIRTPTGASPARSPGSTARCVAGSITTSRRASRR